MKISKVFFSVVAMAISGLFLSGCTENDAVSTISEQEEREIVEGGTSHDATLDAELQAVEVIISENEGGRQAAGCAVVIRDHLSKTITFDFGTGCVGPFGRERSGKIIIAYGGVFGDHLANRVITFENYFVNGKQITGTIELRDFNLDEDGNPTLTRKHSGLTVTFPDGNHFTSNGAITVTWISGFGDEDPANNAFEITGRYEGISSRGRKVTREIIDPLIVNFNCLDEGGVAIVGGKVQMSIEGLNRDRVRIIDYGDGTCDNVVTVTINARVHTITIG